MAKIFVSFFNNIEDPNNPQAMPCFYEGFLQELVKNGNEILCFFSHDWNFSFNKKKCSKQLNEILNFNPDLVITFNNFCFDLTKLLDCPIVIWEADSYLFYKNQEVIKNNKDRFKFIVAQTSEINKIKDFFIIKNNDIFYLPFATAVNAFEIEKSNEIVFVGTQYKDSNYLNYFMQSKPSEKEKKQWLDLVKEVQQNPFISNKQLLKENGINSKKISNFFNTNSVIQSISATERLQILSQISDLGLKIYGDSNWTKLLYFPDLVSSYQNTLLYSISDTEKLYNSSKLGININHAQANTGFSWRVCDIMASNACLITQSTLDLKKLFPKIDFPIFNNKYEARAICQKVLKDKNYRNNLVMQCQEMINKNHRFLSTINNLSQILDIQLINNDIGCLNFIYEKTRKKKHLSTKLKLITLGGLLIANQIPLANKFLMNREQILLKINLAVDNDNFEKLNKS